MALWRKEPGLVASVAAHAALLAAAFATLSSPPKFSDQQEAIAVEVISENAFSTMTQGDRTAKTVQDNPKPRVDRVDEIEQQKPDPGEAKRDVPAPAARPVAEDRTEDRAAVEPAPEPPKPEPPKPVVETPPEPVKVAQPTPPAPAPPVPQPRPQQLAEAQEARPEPPKPEPPKPEPPKPEPPKPEPPKPEPAKPAPPKPTPPKPPTSRAEPAKPASRSPSNKPAEADSIEKLLASRDQPQASGSTGRQQQAASAGTRTGNSPKLSLSQRDAIGNLMKQQIGRCFSAPPGMADVTSAPVIRVSLNEDGTLVGPPEIISGANDPASRSYAESVVRAIRRCAPYNFPAQFAPYYNDWRDWRINAAPGDFLG